MESILINFYYESFFHFYQDRSSYKLILSLSYYQYYAPQPATPWEGGHHCSSALRQTCPGKARWAPVEGSGGRYTAHVLHISQSPLAYEICLNLFFKSSSPFHFALPITTGRKEEFLVIITQNLLLLKFPFGECDKTEWIYSSCIF